MCLLLLLAVVCTKDTLAVSLCEVMEAVAESRIGKECSCDSSCSHACASDNDGSGWCENLCEYCALDHCILEVSESNVVDAREYQQGIPQTNSAAVTYTQGRYAGLQLVVSTPEIVNLDAPVCNMRVIDSRNGIDQQVKTTECACEFHYCDCCRWIFRSDCCRC